MFPPTPTAMVNHVAPVVISAAKYRIWNFTDEAIMLWQWATPARTQVLQVAVLIAILAAFVFIVIRWIQSLTNEGDL